MVNCCCFKLRHLNLQSTLVLKKEKKRRKKKSYNIIKGSDTQRINLSEKVGCFCQKASERCFVPSDFYSFFKAVSLIHGGKPTKKLTLNQKRRKLQEFIFQSKLFISSERSSPLNGEAWYRA